MPLGIISYVDMGGVRHSVEVEAEGLYEAAVLGIAAFRKDELTPAGLTELHVEVRSTITHDITDQKVQQCLTRK